MLMTVTASRTALRHMISPAPTVAPGLPAVFLDRDGVINVEVHYLNNPNQLEFIPGVIDAVLRINALGLPVIIVTNQSAIARGKLSEDGLTSIHNRLIDMFNTAGCVVAGIYASPYHPGVEGPYGRHTDCRKPEPGMLYAASEDLSINLSKSVIIGDKRSDLGAGRAAGVAATVLVRTGHGLDEEPKLKSGEADFVADDLAQAVELLIETGRIEEASL